MVITGLGADLYFINESRRAGKNSAWDVFISPTLRRTIAAHSLKDNTSKGGAELLK